MELNERTLKELVSTIRKFDGIMPAFIDVLFGHLRRDDCDLRIGILLIANHFFQRSHYFRLELINSMQDFLICTLEIDPLHFPLPNPADAAELLKKETMKMLRLWIEKFGPGYPKLQRMANFLKNSKSFDWENSEVNLQIDREREELDRFQRELRARKIVEKLAKIFDDSKSEIERIQIEANSVLELLIPRFCSMETTKNDANEGNDDEAKPLFAFGESTNGISICLNPNEIGQIDRTEENCDLINQLKDTTKQLEHWHTKLGKWIGKLTEIGDSSALMRKLIDIRRFLNEELQKCREIKIFMSQNEENESSDDSENDDEFLDVEEKEGYEPGFSAGIEEPKSTSSTAPIICCDEPGPSGIQNVVVNSFEKNNGEKIDNKCPPKLAMGLDLKYWGENDIKPAQRVQNQGEEHWWRQMENNDTLTESMETYNCRQITFISQKPPEIERICRAPLPSGKLCPRRQIHRCTLHGPIIERDEQGFPINEQKQIENEKGGINEQQKRQDEEEYLRDIEAVTGVKLGGPEKRAAGRTARTREKSENLKTRERLKIKLFDKRTLKRVTTTLEHMQKARAERNFSHQFNYALSNKK